MPLKLESVEDYILNARVLLLDQTQPYRYQDTELVVALNLSLLEGRRLRPDLFVHKWGSEVPSFAAPSGEHVPIESQFRLAFVYGMLGQALLRDDEDVQDERATTFMNRFEYMLTGRSQAPPVQGGTPPPGNAQR